MAQERQLSQLEAWSDNLAGETTMLNATHLFEKPARHRHNSESWWSAFFSMLMLYEARINPSFVLPIYNYSKVAGFRRIANLETKTFSFSTIQVDVPLSARIFDLAAWPDEVLNLKIDVSILEPERRRVTFIENKTIGAAIGQNVSRYGQVCTHLSQNGWSAELNYLLSHGHETAGDWLLIERNELRIILWEDVLRAAFETPFARVFDVDLAAYATRPAGGIVGEGSGG